jgi:hypothetical protein
MAAIIKLANQLNKHAQDKEEIQQYLATENNGWKAFFEGEVKRSNDLNNKSLGGQ